jgi:hypothetical protein
MSALVEMVPHNGILGSARHCIAASLHWRVARHGPVLDQETARMPDLVARFTTNSYATFWMFASQVIRQLRRGRVRLCREH